MIRRNFPFTVGTMRSDYSEPEPGLINGFIMERYDMCPFCRSQDIELLSFNNMGESYRQALDAYLSGYTVTFDKYPIHSMKCKKCHKEFIIDWSTGFPRPLNDICQYELFMYEFSMGI